MTIITRTLLVLGIGVVVSLGQAVQVGEKPAGGDEQKAKPRITVSQETTRVMGPLRADGFINYVAALNQYISQGVTPDNNSAVLVIQAFGPGGIPHQDHQQWFDMLGIAPLTEEGPYLVGYHEYAERALKVASPDRKVTEEDRFRWSDEEYFARSQPWTKETFPTVAAWLEASERPLALIVEAAKRPRRYEPLMAAEDPPTVAAVIVGLPNTHRYAGELLATRAIFRLGTGKVDEAWQDLLSSHRLSRLAGQRVTLIEMLRATGLEDSVCDADQLLLVHGALTAKQARQMYNDLQQLPPFPRMVDTIDVAERYFFLDTAQFAAEKGLAGLALDADWTKSNMVVDFLSEVVVQTVDWDAILRMGNSWYDRFVVALRTPTWTERCAAVNKVNAEFDKLLDGFADVRSAAGSVLDRPRHALSERVGLILMAQTMPAVDAAACFEARTAERFEILKLGFLLAVYRAEHGAYPAQLSDLVPTYVAEVPLDPFSGKPVIYRCQGTGYVLYSVGINGQDDGGRGQGDRSETGDVNQDCDDLVVRVR